MNLLKWVKLQNAHRHIIITESFSLQGKMSYNLLSNKNTTDFFSLVQTSVHERPN